jgi:hypothetical protein
MKIDPTTGTWQDNPGCPINITLVSTSDERANSNNNNGGGKRKPSPGKSDPLKRFKSMISAMGTKQIEVMQAMADAQQAGISAMLAGSTYPAAKVVMGSTVALPITDAKEVLMERTNVAALKLQGILKANKKA